MYQNLSKRHTKLFIKVGTSKKRHEIFIGNSKIRKSTEGCISSSERSHLPTQTTIPSKVINSKQIFLWQKEIYIQLTLQNAIGHKYKTEENDKHIQEYIEEKRC